MKTKMKKTIYTLIAIIGFANFTIAQQWLSKTNMPDNTTAAASCELNNKIYVVGGSVSTGATNKLNVYDPLTNSWSSKTGMLSARSGCGLAALNGKLYVIGGYNNGALNTMEEYDPISDTWTAKASMSLKRSELSVGVVNNKIYAVGGNPGFFDPNFNSAIVEEFNPVTNSWVTKASMPQGRCGSNSIQVIGNMLYYIGGKDVLSNIEKSNCFKYNPFVNTWSSISNIPQAVWAGATASIGSKIHYFGGGNGNLSSIYNYHYIYDTLTNIWITDLLMTSSRAYITATQLKSNFYVFGGMDSINQSLNTVQALMYCINSFSKQPINQTVNTNSNVSFIVATTDSLATYQWQTDLGVGFQNLNNVGQYSGVTNDTLNVSNVTMSNNNQPFRCIVSSGSCKDTSSFAKLTVNNNTGINSPSNVNAIKVYPNPASTILHIDLEKPGYYTAKLSSVAGQSIISQTTGTIDISALANGVYFLTIYDSNNKLISTNKVAIVK